MALGGSWRDLGSVGCPMPLWLFLGSPRSWLQGTYTAEEQDEGDWPLLSTLLLRGQYKPGAVWPLRVHIVYDGATFAPSSSPLLTFWFQMSPIPKEADASSPVTEATLRVP